MPLDAASSETLVQRRVICTTQHLSFEAVLQHVAATLFIEINVAKTLGKCLSR